MSAPRLRYARQYVLPEIGTEGQARIEAQAVRAGAGDARAVEVALAYLERAGMACSSTGAPLAGPSEDEVARIAGRPELREAAAFLAGALAATARLAHVAGVAAPPVAHVPDLSTLDR